MILLDTSILIEFYRKKEKSGTIFYKLFDENQKLSVSTITVFEIYRGATKQQEHLWDLIFEKITVLPFEEDAAKLYQQLKSLNRLIDLPDLLIASIGISCDLPLATLNLRDFSRVPGLTLHQFQK